MKIKSIILGVFLAVILFVGTALISKTKDSDKAQESKQYAQVLALESHVRGGLGRSKLIVTYPDGHKEEGELENYQSMTGINIGNITGNEKAIVGALNKLSSQGYQMKWLESGVSEGVYVTKYVFEKTN